MLPFGLRGQHCTALHQSSLLFVTAVVCLYSFTGNSSLSLSQHPLSPAKAQEVTVDVYHLWKVIH